MAPFSAGVDSAKSSSRQQTVADHPSPRRWKALILIAAVIATVLIGGGVYLRQHSVSLKLTEKDTIVLADFANTTGDSVFDDTLKQALSVGLQQSPFLNILSDQRVKDTLGLGRAT